MTNTHYGRAPIIEAVIDLRVDPSPSLNWPSIERMAAELNESYPAVETLRSVEFSVLNQAGAPAEVRQGQLSEQGVRLSAPSLRRAIRFDLQGFSFSHLPPYSAWEDFKASAGLPWDVFLRHAGDVTVNRLAIRVINKFVLPPPPIKLADYLHIGLSFPPDLPSEVDSFYLQTQITIPMENVAAHAIINFVGGQQTHERSEVFLDFDLFVSGRFAPGSPEIWTILDQLSAHKNQLFEACITDATRELIR